MDLIIRARDVHGMSSIYVTKRLDEFPYLATHVATVRDSVVTISKVDSTAGVPRTKILVLESGRVVFSGSISEFETSSLPAVRRLTQADNGTAFSDYKPLDPWDTTRKPSEEILLTASINFECLETIFGRSFVYSSSS